MSAILFNGQNKPAITFHEDGKVDITSSTIKRIASDGIYIPQSFQSNYGGKNRVTMQDSDGNIDPLFKKAMEEIYVPDTLAVRGFHWKK